MVTFSSLHLLTGLARVLLEILPFFFFPHPFTEMAFERRVGRRTADVAGPGADGDGSCPLFTVCILNLHRSCHKGSGSRCLEASWELIFFFSVTWK